MKKALLGAAVGLLLVAFLAGCAATVYAPGPPPPPKAEIKPHAPGPKAVWVSGHWNWTSHNWVWIPGSWVKKAKGHWVPGYWKRGLRGYGWVRGHWRR